ncbi:MAG: hypothetical protein FJ083_17930 [Cyanobacteria bacterium K_Offshore_surface_m2_239]|nr:hypothetical protein [Cyanobacteria bacterium K_Offshore_surface_m2_239]
MTLLHRLPPWLRSGDVHEWSKTVAVVVAALWGVYTFIWKDILVPSWAPVSLVIEVKPRQEGAEARPEAGGTAPSRLRLRVIATNPSSRAIFLLPNVWWASAMQRKQADPGRSFESAANAVLRDPSVLQAERGEELVSVGVVATGRLFIDDQIQPGETLSRDLSIALPRGESPLVLQWLVPALTRKPVRGSGQPLLFAGQRLGWGYNEENDVLHPVLCKNSAAGVNCQARDVGLIQNEIKAFDPKSVVFSKTLLIND